MVAFVVRYAVEMIVEKHVFSAGFNCSQAICLTLEKIRVLGFLGLINVQKDNMLQQI